MKKMILYLLTLSLLASVLACFPLFAETKTLNDMEGKSMQRLMDLGIFTQAVFDDADLNRYLTREELAKILVLVNGQQKNISLYKSSSLFSDVDKDRWSNPYIQIAVKMGYMTKMPDGKFHPADTVTFAQAATVIGRLLGYDETNLTGSYPQNYLTQLTNLDILEGISYTAGGNVTRGQIAVMIDRLFHTEVYGSDKTFIDTISCYKSAVILKNNVLNANDDPRKLVTSQGTYYLKEGPKIPEAGKRYILRLEGTEIEYAAMDGLEYKEISVRSISSGTITANNGDQVTIAAGIPFFYNGEKTDYSTVSASISANSSVVVAYDGTDAVYGALFDPLYTEPRIVTADMALGVQFAGKLIEKGGKYVTAAEIEVNDVIYEVTDIWGKNGYILVYDDAVSGRITAILPNKVSPLSIEIDGTAYKLDASFPRGKLNDSGRNQVGETAKLILGSEGTVVDIISESIRGTTSYALVLRAYSENSTASEDFGTTYYYVTLLHSNGAKETYLSKTAMTVLRGSLVTYEITAHGKDYDTVALTQIDTKTTGSYRVGKDQRMIGDSYVANGAVLFNIKSTSSAEIDASVISFSDLYEGVLINGKVKYIHRSGDFMDIDIMVLNDALDENVGYGLVTAKTGASMISGQEMVVNDTITFLVNGETMTYKGRDSGVFLGSVARITLSDSSVDAIENAISAEAISKEIQAVDSTRIRINDKVYTFHNKVAVYKRKNDSEWLERDISGLTKGTGNGSVTLYLDKPLSSGGKVVMVLLR